MEESYKLIIACEAFKGELAHFKDSIQVDIHWIEHSLHNFPKQLTEKINEKVHEAEGFLPEGAKVLLFFGNCGGALEEVYSKTLTLLYPDVDDCIPILIGSGEKFRRLQKERPGTFYLNKAWIDSGQDPGGTSRGYINTYGEIKGWKVSRKMYRHYTHFALIDNGCYDLDPYRNYVKETCQTFEKEYIEEKGDLSYVKAILNCQSKMKKITVGD